MKRGEVTTLAPHLGKELLSIGRWKRKIILKQSSSVYWNLLITIDTVYGSTKSYLNIELTIEDTKAHDLSIAARTNGWWDLVVSD